ncbi:MAG: SGNH/GDSL hydrolase family protein [Opitutales bacterium]|nr:SGNH/GDSL hydrolase family protein [Opitutales bacterium]
MLHTLYGNSGFLHFGNGIRRSNPSPPTEPQPPQSVIAFYPTVDTVFPMNEPSSPSLQWIDLRDLGLRGMAWNGEPRENPYDRLPAALKKELPEGLWRQGICSGGLYVDFIADTPWLYASWDIEGDPPNDPFTAPAGQTGVDLYGQNENGHWAWIGAQAYPDDQNSPAPLNRHPLAAGSRRYRLYLPLRRRTTKASLGLPKECPAPPAVPAPTKYIAYYGTSIVHGAGVSRAGLSHASQIGRGLAPELKNLGFCGTAKLEPEMAEMLAKLDPRLFIIDPLPNNTAPELTEKLPRFLEILRHQRPQTPILLLGDRQFGDSTFLPQRLLDYEEKNTALRNVFAQLPENDPTHLHIDDNWYGADFEGTSDASHPNDLGASHMAETLLPIIRELLDLQE